MDVILFVLVVALVGSYKRRGEGPDSELADDDRYRRGNCFTDRTWWPQRPDRQSGRVPSRHRVIDRVYACGGMGAGDVKLFGAVGSCLGPSGVMQAALVVALSGGIYALVVRPDTGDGERRCAVSIQAVRRSRSPVVRRLLRHRQVWNRRSVRHRDRAGNDTDSVVARRSAVGFLMDRKKNRWAG